MFSEFYIWVRAFVNCNPITKREGLANKLSLRFFWYRTNSHPSFHFAVIPSLTLLNVHFFAIYIVIACLKLAPTDIEILVLLLNLWIDSHAKGINGFEKKIFSGFLCLNVKTRQHNQSLLQ